MNLPSVFGLKGLAVAVAIGAALGGVASWRVTRALADREIADMRAAAITSQLNAAKADLRIDKGARDEASAAAAAIDEQDRRNQEIVNAPPVSPDANCSGPIGDAGLRWLRQIR